jgi:hypothetical protein
MELVRLGNTRCQQSEDAVYRRAEESTVQVLFRDFGLGDVNTSDFRVDLTWKDIENLINEFAVIKEPAAIALKQAKSLAVAARREGWSPKDDFSN